MGVPRGYVGVDVLFVISGFLITHWDHTPIDFFFSYDALHDSCCERRREVPFSGKRITILSAEDLAVFKVLFDRGKDWRDLEEIRFAQAASCDAEYVASWLERILPRDDPRLACFDR